MRRQLLLLAGLACAVAIAVLLRTNASDIEPVLADEPAGPDSSVVAEFTLEDCTITGRAQPHMTSSEAAQPSPSVPSDASSLSLAPNVDCIDAAPALVFDLIRPPPQDHLARVTIRPPPQSHAV